MRTLKSVRSVFVALFLAAIVTLPMVGATATAADPPRGSIHIHTRVCPLNLPPGSMLFDSCHQFPGPEGARFKIDSRQSKDINSAGNVSFGRVTAGDHLVTLTSDFQPNEFLRLRAFCSNLATGTGPNEAFIRSGDQADFWVRVAPGSRLVCDVYFIPISGR